MKHKNLKVKRACFILASSFVLYGYLKYDHVYNPSYVITEEEPYFATYTNGRIYIGTLNEINQIKDQINKNDIIVYDERDGSDPNMKIVSSYKIKDKDIRNEILEVLLIYEELYPSD